MGALSGNRLRPNADCSCYRSRLVDPLSARLPDRTPPRRGKHVEPSRTTRLAQSGAIREFVAVRPAGSDEGASPPPSSPNPRPSPRPLRLRRSGPAPRLEGGLSVNRALSVSALLQTGAVNRVRPQNGWRTERLSSRRRCLNRHGVTPPPRRCDPSTGPTLQNRGRGWPERS